MPVLIILFLSLNTVFSPNSLAASNLQLKMGDSLSVYSNKAYRRNQGKTFEAVGNVVILYGKETVYGEAASIDLISNKFTIEGNVRFISKDITVYGSKINYDIKTGKLEINNARIATEGYYVVAKKLLKLDKLSYHAIEAEYSTCRDCPESWTVYGDDIKLTLGEYIHIRHALFKINTVNVMYLPYLVLPAKRRRETGLLFPTLSTRLGEGVAFQQPWFWAISDQNDLTLGPTFWAKRGYGADIEYRHVFGDEKWVQLNSRALNDEIYQPEMLNTGPSGDRYFRHFSTWEHHFQFGNRLTHHLKATDMKDIDIFRDFPLYVDPQIRGSESTTETFFDYRGDNYAVSTQASLNRNLLYNDPVKNDSEYVQVLPSIEVATNPLLLTKSKTQGLKSIYLQLKGDVTRFGQIQENETQFLRNYNRYNITPELTWNMFTIGPVNMKSTVKFDYQTYRFHDEQQEDYSKSATLLKTEISFGLEKVFGLSYVEEVDPQDQVADSKSENNQNVSKKLIGNFKPFEQTLVDNTELRAKHSYKHGQEFKFIHHYISSHREKGNARFNNQIQSNLGWNDYVDAIRSEESQLGSNATRTIINPFNTLEFQWNNVLIKKTPKDYDFLEDYRYLRDNFNYARIGYFNISQGVEVKNNYDEEEYNLTRLYLNTGYSTGAWDFNTKEYYFHDSRDHILSTSVYRNFDVFKFFTSFNYNTFQLSALKTMGIGFHLRPIDKIGFTVNQEYDWQTDRTVRSVYAVDYIPDNNCWKLNLSYINTIVGNRLSFDFVLNFGSTNFSQPDTTVNRL